MRKWLLVLLMILTPGAPLFMKWVALRKVRKHVGKPVPETADIGGNGLFTERLYYFHAPYCGPCKTMKPMIENLQQEFTNLIDIDVTDKPALAQAFGVTATPTFILVKDNCVSAVKIGAQRESWIRKQFTTAS